MLLGQREAPAGVIPDPRPVHVLGQLQGRELVAPKTSFSAPEMDTKREPQLLVLLVLCSLCSQTPALPLPDAEAPSNDMADELVPTAMPVEEIIEGIESVLKVLATRGYFDKLPPEERILGEK
ncbi:uncharacterized protein WM277_015948 isoform 1-T1 [Molossus nigricans]